MAIRFTTTFVACARWHQPILTHATLPFQFDDTRGHAERRVTLNVKSSYQRVCWRSFVSYPKWDSNPHIFRYCILSATRLPIPPFGLGTLTILHNFAQLPNVVDPISHVQ